MMHTDAVDQPVSVADAAADCRALPSSPGASGTAPLHSLVQIAQVLWQHVLRYDPRDPGWPDRDRCVIAHAQAATLQHLLASHSIAGMQEPQVAPALQLARAIGLAAADAALGRHFNRPGHEVVGHRTYVLLDPALLSDPWVQQLCNRAARSGLHRLIVFCEQVLTQLPEDWDVIEDVVATQPLTIVSAVRRAHRHEVRPTLVLYRAGGADTARRRGAALGLASTAREALARRGAKLSDAWRQGLRGYAASYPYLAAELRRRLRDGLPLDWALQFAALLQAAAARRTQGAAPRATSSVLAELRASLPELIDAGNDLPRAAGMAAHGGVLPFACLGLQGIEAALPMIRSSAQLRRGAIFTCMRSALSRAIHHPASCACAAVQQLLAIPHLDVWQPADELELLWAWRAAVERRDGCSALLLPEVLSMPERNVFFDEDPGKGAYIVAEDSAPLRAVLIATGAQLPDALAAQRTLRSRGLPTRVVSLPCQSVFERQPLRYRTRVLPDEIPHIYAHQLAAGCLEQRADPAGEHREHRATAQALVDAVAACVAGAAPRAPQALSARGAL